MKTFFKKNLIWVFALVVGIGTMSFKVIQKQNVSEYWFEVINGYEVTNNPAPPDCDDNEGAVCAVAFTQDSVPDGVETIDDAYAHGAYAGEAKRQ